MKFDVIVGNPPYQLKDGGNGASASPIYQLFVRQAKKLQPKYLAFIIPSRWFIGGKGLDDFRDEMMHDHDIKVLVDYPNSSDCFPGVQIMGGVCYFVRESGYNSLCEYTIMSEEVILSKSKRYLDEGNAGIVVRYPEMITILNKVREMQEETMDTIVSSRKPYGLASDFFKDPKKYGFPAVYKTKKEVTGASISVHGLEGGKRVVRYVPLGYPFAVGRETITKWKIFIPNAYGCSAIGENNTPTPVLSTPILGGSLTTCTETFLRIGPWDNENEANNALSYLKTKFFRFLVGIKKTTQHTSKDTYSLVPLLDFTEEWTDEKLYRRYNLSQEEINFIEKNVKEMK